MFQPPHPRVARPWVLALVLALASTACGDAAGEAGPIARFSTGGALDFDAAPFPGDFRRVDGALTIGALPTDKSGEPLFDRLRALLSSRDGFCATCNVYFPIEGALDAASVPRETEGLPTDAVVLVDAEPGSPEYGRLFPLVLEWSAQRSTLALRPAPGAALGARRRYAAAVTTALRGEGGEPLRASSTFEPMREALSADLVPAGVHPSASRPRPCSPPRTSSPSSARRTPRSSEAIPPRSWSIASGAPAPSWTR